jgi:hypothetical protein
MGGFRNGVTVASRWWRRAFAVMVAGVLASIGAYGLVGARAAMADPAPVCPCSLFSSSTVPAVVSFDDPNAVELGVSFYSDTAGFIDGIRFYKSTENTGVHIGSLWSSSGQLLAQATFTSESSSGWQEVDFSTPVAVTAGTMYVASYHTDTGFYSVSPGFFLSSGYDNAPLHAPGGNGGNPNGLFVYSPVPMFPTGTFNGNNYYVDAVFTPAAVPATMTVTAASATAPKGTTLQMDAQLMTGGVTSEVTSQANWASSDPTVATVSPLGVVTGVGQGMATVTASLNGVTGSFQVTVGPPVLQSISIAAPAASVPDRVSEQLQATGTFSDGTTADETAQATWASASPQVATVNPSGQVTAVGRGLDQVTATVGSVTGQTTIGGLAPVLLLTVQPPLSVLVAGNGEQLQTVAFLTDGSRYAATALTSWGVLTGSAVTVSSTGAVTSSHTGVGLITATLGHSSQLALIVVSPPAHN